MHRIGEGAKERGRMPLATSALSPRMVACVNAMLASTQKQAPNAGFSNDEIVELLESLMPEPGQVLEPVWSARRRRWQWQPVS